MDKTMLEERKEELKLVSEEICNLLHALSFMHPMTSGFKKELNKQIFVKPNPKLFLDVFHYLFVILDPDEFKKRFYWPIFDKLTENHFRSGTVEYLNFIKEKYKLDIESVKRYLVVMPGGVKFLTVLHRLTVLVVTEEMKKKGWRLDNFRMLTENTLDEVLQRKKICVHTANEYKSVLGQLNKEILQKTDFINKKINTYFNGKRLTIDQTTIILDKWQQDNKTTNEIIIRPFSDNLHKIINSIDNFVNVLAKYLERNNNLLIKYDQELVKKTLNKLINNDLIIFHDNGRINVINLLKLLESILPNILLKIKYYNKPNLNYDLHEINSISPVIDKIINDVISMKNLNSERKRIKVFNNHNYNDSINENNNNKFLLKIINTPNILYKKGLNENNNEDHNKFRLFQQNDMNNKFINPLNILRTVKKAKRHNNSIVKDLENLKLSAPAKQLNAKIKNNFLYNDNLIDNVLSTPNNSLILNHITNNTTIINFSSPDHNQLIKKSLNFLDKSPSGRLDLSSFDDFRKIDDSFSVVNTTEKNLHINLLLDEKTNIDDDKTTLFDVSDSVLNDVIE